MRVVVTGANGFVGRAVCAELAARGHHVVACVRDRQAARKLSGFDVVLTGGLEREPDLSVAFSGADAVVHTANWTGVVTSETTIEYVDAVNVRATARIGALAARCGVGQFVFLSSIKAMGNRTDKQPFKVSTPPEPKDLYGRSKLQAERALLETEGLVVSIIRPPLLYGPGVTGSVLKLFQLAERGVPLPLRSVKNARDLLAIQSLADLVAHCIERPSASSRILLARDGQAISSAGLFRSVAASMGREARLFPFSPTALRIAAALAGRQANVDSLLSSLEIDDSQTRYQLGWSPVCCMQDALEATAKWYLAGCPDLK